MIFLILITAPELRETWETTMCGAHIRANRAMPHTQITVIRQVVKGTCAECLIDEEEKLLAARMTEAGR
jgi:hypothetical protein